jgi:transcriptional regulator with XRE-family HTH domain
VVTYCKRSVYSCKIFAIYRPPNHPACFSRPSVASYFDLAFSMVLGYTPPSQAQVGAYSQPTDLTNMATKKKAASKSELAASFGKWIKDKRTDARLTQTEAALRAEMSRVYLARIEAGEIPSRGRVLSLAAALGVPEAEALHRAGYSSGVEEEEMPMAMIHFRMLSPAAQELVAKHIDELRKLEEVNRKIAEKAEKTGRRR